MGGKQIIIKHFDETTNTASLTTDQWYDANAYLRSIGVNFQKADEKEEWIDVKGYEGIYQVSSYGRVKSLPRTISHSNGTQRTVKEKYGWRTFRWFLQVLERLKDRYERLILG